RETTPMAKEAGGSLSRSHRRTLCLELLEDRQLLSGMGFPTISQVFSLTPAGAASSLAVGQPESSQVAAMPGTPRNVDMVRQAGDQNSNQDQGAPVSGAVAQEMVQAAARYDGTLGRVPPNAAAEDPTPGDSAGEPAAQASADQPNAAL